MCYLPGTIEASLTVRIRKKRLSEKANSEWREALRAEKAAKKERKKALAAEKAARKEQQKALAAAKASAIVAAENLDGHTSTKNETFDGKGPLGKGTPHEPESRQAVEMPVDNSDPIRGQKGEMVSGSHVLAATNSSDQLPDRSRMAVNSVFKGAVKN